MIEDSKDSQHEKSPEEIVAAIKRELEGEQAEAEEAAAGKEVGGQTVRFDAAQELEAAAGDAEKTVLFNLAQELEAEGAQPGEQPTVVASAAQAAPRGVVPFTPSAVAGSRFTDGQYMPGTPESEEEIALKEQAAQRRKRIALMVVAGVLIAIVGAYLYGVSYFSHTFLPYTSINGEDVSLKPASDVARANSSSVEEYSLAVTGEGLELALSSEDIGLSFDGNAYAEAGLAQLNPWGWPLAFFDARTLSVEQAFSFDTRKLNTAVGTAVDALNEKAVAPKDATISYEASSHSYVITPEVAGNTLDREKVIAKVSEAATKSERSVTIDSSSRKLPQLLKDDARLTGSVDKANACIKATQILTNNEVGIAEIGADTISQWISLDEDFEIAFDSEACETWCRGELSEKLDTVGSTRSFKRLDGASFTVSGGSYGWILNGSETAAIIQENIMAGKSASFEAPWKQEGAQWAPGGQDWPKRYIDIDLAAQHVRMYDDSGKLIWESDCVSGKVTDDHATPTGVYSMNDNRDSGDVVLRGEIDPKTNKPEYISHVKFWMPFIGNSHALHDASWRSNFGGNIYYDGGSHGCINLPSDKAEELFKLTKVGDVVVVH